MLILTCNSLEGLFVHIHDIAVRTAPSGMMLSGRRHFTRRELTDAAVKRKGKICEIHLLVFRAIHCTLLQTGGWVLLLWAENV